jgi:restriction endonuclease Mrr
MRTSPEFEGLVTWLIRTAGQSDRAEISEEQAIRFLQQEFAIDRVTAIAEWQDLIGKFQQKKIVRDGHLVQWHMFRSGFQVSTLATVEEIQSTAEIYHSTTDEELMRKIRSLSGIAFERFLGAVLARRPEYRNITVTQSTRDGGIDFRGHYVPTGMPSLMPLIGQAKQVSVPVSASVARDFIGALDTAPGRKAVGLLVSTAGFTAPAVKALEASHFNIFQWDMAHLLKICRGIATRQIALSFEVPDETFWDEVSD